MSHRPSLVFIPGAWHKPTCYDKIVKQLEERHNIRCTLVTLPSTNDNPDATFKDDIDAARTAIASETSQGRDVIVVAHSYGGMVGNSVIKGLTRHKSLTTTSPTQSSTETQHGYVAALVLIASGFTITGLAFMDPFFGIPPPSWRVNKETGYAELVANPREFFYHDVADEEAEYRVSQLTTQGLKALFEGGEYVYAGWQDVPTWYIGTAQDKGLPVVVQRVQVGVARELGAEVHHSELNTSHSPFLSKPDQVVAVLLDAVATVSCDTGSVDLKDSSETGGKDLYKGMKYETASVRLSSPRTWLKFGIPLFVGHLIGKGIFWFLSLRGFWRKKRV